MNRVFLFLSAACLAAFTLSLNGQTTGQRIAGPEESHAIMLRLLNEVHASTPDTNPFLGDFEVRQLRAQLSQLDLNATATQRFDLLLNLGLRELDQGNEQEAIRYFEHALSLQSLTRYQSAGLMDCLFQLSIAYLRMGETENCCRQNNPDSCLFPLKGGGIHTNQKGSGKASFYLEQLLGRADLPPDWQAESAWLLNIAHMTLGTWPESVDPRWRIEIPDDSDAANPFPPFPNIAADRNLGTFSLAGGVIADDFNGDGRIDLVISSWDPGKDIRYLQQAPDHSFIDGSDDANFRGLKGGLNLIQGDYDNDGDLDIFVLRGGWLGGRGNHPNSLLRNEGPGARGIPRFVDVTFLVGLGTRFAPTQTAGWADFDLDGDLDLFVGNESRSDFPNPSHLYRNDGGVFVDIAAPAGVENNRYTKGSSWGDYDNDGDPDLYLSNLEGPNRLYRNEGNGTFVDVAPELGVVDPVRSFPSWFWDFNNDGNLDIFASNYTNGGRIFWPYYRGNPLKEENIAAVYQGDGSGQFVKATRQLSLDVPMLPMGSNFGDLDNDGFPDVYLGTGTPNYSDIVPNQLFMNQGGKTFVDRTAASRMGSLQKGHGVAFADFDGDGDLDVFEQMGGAVRGDAYYDALFDNPGFPGTHWIQVRLIGVQTNRFGIGCRLRAVIEEEGRGERSVYCQVNSGGSFGASPLTQHLGLGTASRLKRLEIHWPVSGQVQILKDIPADQRIAVTEGEDRWTKF